MSARHLAKTSPQRVAMVATSLIAALIVLVAGALCQATLISLP